MARISPLVASIRARIRLRQPITDDQFDALYPATHRHRSLMHWTPVEVALVATDWLASSPGGSVLDVGSGVGKACHVGTLASNIHWSGVERDATMVRIAKRISVELSIESRTSFIHAEALEIDWSRFGGVYLFNPFAESVYMDEPPDPMLRQAIYCHEVLGVERKLLELTTGARVVTYHGFGGEMPSAFELVDMVDAHTDVLSIWVRR